MKGPNNKTNHSLIYNTEYVIIVNIGNLGSSKLLGSKQEGGFFVPFNLN